MNENTVLCLCCGRGDCLRGLLDPRNRGKLIRLSDGKVLAYRDLVYNHAFELREGGYFCVKCGVGGAEPGSLELCERA